MKPHAHPCGIVAIAIISLATLPAARAADVADFYRGKTVNLIAGFNPGGSADTHARVIARHLGRHIPGNPTVIVQNMQGASSAIAANHVFNLSPKDGSELGLFAGNITTDPVMGGTQFKFDAQRFNWIGAPSSASNVCLSAPATPFKTIDHVLAREMIVGATGTAGNSTFDFPTVLNNVLETKFRIVKGYAGSAALNLAMSRGEIDGFCGVGYDFLRGMGLTGGKANILIQLGLSKNPNMPNVPFIMDYARNEPERQILRLVFGWLDFERPIGAPPGTPPERVDALRDGFDRTMSDPIFLADAARVQVTIEPMNGKAIARFIAEAYQTPPAEAAKAAHYLGRGR